MPGARYLVRGLSRCEPYRQELDQGESLGELDGAFIWVVAQIVGYLGGSISLRLKSFFFSFQF